MLPLLTVADSIHEAVRGAGPLTHIWDNPPELIVTVVVFLVALAGLVAALTPLAKMVRSVTSFARRLLPQDDEARNRRQQRRMFARHVAEVLTNLAVREDWRDERFTEIEAIVEVEGRERPWLRWVTVQRREKPLSRELGRARESLIVLTGEPGSGKSVALRHLAERLARRAQKKHLADSVIPLYINLKGFRPANRPVDGEAVRDFILQSLTNHRDLEVNEFLEKEFNRGMLEGWWLLLLDSFDEIPDVLNATENDGTVTEYTLAIKDFVSGWRRGQAIIASREYHGPSALKAPRFKIIELTAERQADLVRRSGLTVPQQATVHAGLAVAEPQLQADAKNPMFLSLICEYVRAQGGFPSSSHETYDHYAKRRLSRDADRKWQRHKARYDTVRKATEKIAFVMTATDGLGLSAAYAELRTALAANGVPGVEFDAVLGALGDTKLGHTVDDPDGSGVPRFTFAHRRFQEYFATCAVLEKPGRVSDRELLTNARWRETAVTLLQLQPPEVTTSLLEEATRLLRPMVRAGVRKSRARRNSVGFSWPNGSRHLLQLLDAGLGHAPSAIGTDIRNASGRLLRAAWENGERHDRKWAVSVALVADRATTIWLVAEAFKSGSAYLGGAAYHVVSRMADPPESLYQGIRQTLVDKAAVGYLRGERVTLAVQISRLPNPEPLLRVLRLLVVVQVIDPVLAVAIVAAVSVWHPVLLAIYVVIIPVAIRYLPSYVEHYRKGNKARQVVPWLWATFAAGFIPIFFAIYNYAFGPFAIMHRFLLWSPPAVLVAAILYCCIWVFSVPYVSINRLATQFYKWPIMPVSCLIDICLLCIRSIVSGDNWQARSTARRVCFVLLLLLVPIFLVIVAIALLVAICAAALYLIEQIWDHFLRARWEHAPPAVHRELSRYWPLSLLGVVALLGLIGAVGLWGDWRARRSAIGMLKHRGGEIDVEDLLVALSRVKTNNAADAIIRMASNADLVNSKNLAQILFDLTRIEPKKLARDQPVGLEVGRLLDICKLNQILIIRGSAERAHDTIAQAVERAELARRENQVP